MVNLVSRQKSSDGGGGVYRDPTGDEESLLRRNPDISPSDQPDSTPPETATGAAAAGTLRLRVLFRKFVLSLSHGRESNESNNGRGGILQDVAVGVIFGVFAVSFMIFLDHHNIIHLQSAHNFRDSTFNLLNDPETIMNLEESTDMKFISVKNYNAIELELSEAQTKIASGKEQLEVQTKKAEERQQEIGPLKEEYEKVVSTSNLGLDKFCGTCKWGGTTCQGRAQFLMDTYGNSELIAKSATMRGGGVQMLNLHDFVQSLGHWEK